MRCAGDKTPFADVSAHADEIGEEAKGVEHGDTCLAEEVGAVGGELVSELLHAPGSFLQEGQAA